MIGKRARRPDVPGRRSESARQDTSQRPSAEDLSSRYAFRRNRTLTGSSSANISSSNELNAQIRSPRAHVHHLTSLRRRLLLYTGLVAAACFGLYVLVFQLVATVLPQSGTSAVVFTDDSKAIYASAIESYYAARPAERFRFLLDHQSLVDHVRAEHPEVADIIMNSGSKPGEATASVLVREPIARWSIDGSFQYVDGNGVVFSRNYFDDPKLQIVDNSGVASADNQLVASNRFLGFIGRVVSKSTSNGLNVQTVTIPALTTRQVAVTMKGSTTEYKLSVDRSAGQQVEDMARVARYLRSNGITPRYVDVRLSGKAFYR